MTIEHPRVPDPSDVPPWRRLRRMLGPEADELLRFARWADPQVAPSGTRRRDGFFWYLLFLNILLLGAVGWLVSAAVLRTYFP